MSTAPFTWTGAGVLFDMDGTLVDSTPSVVRSWNRLFRELGTNLTFTHELHGMPARRVLATAMPTLVGEEFEEAFARVEQLEIEDAGDVTILPGAQRLLDELDAVSDALQRPVWTVVTSATWDLWVARWAALDRPLPEHAVTVDHVDEGKPHPAPYLLGMERLGCAAEKTMVIEDAPGGIQSGLAAGACVSAVTTTNAADVVGALAHHAIGTLDDLHADLVQGEVRLTHRG